MERRLGGGGAGADEAKEMNWPLCRDLWVLLGSENFILMSAGSSRRRNMVRSVLITAVMSVSVMG